MYNLEPLIDEVRDIIDKWEGSHAVLEDRRTRMQLCSCLDVIKDTALCLNAFRTTNIGELDVGSKYMYVYGSLQALVLQQDAVKTLHMRSRENISVPSTAKGDSGYSQP